MNVIRRFTDEELVQLDAKRDGNIFIINNEFYKILYADGENNFTYVSKIDKKGEVMICKNCDTDIKGSGFILCADCGEFLHIECSSQCTKCGNNICDSCLITQKFKCKQCYNVDVHTMEFMSATMFESYLKCPYAFKHEYILNTIPEEERNNKYSLIGSMLHDLFEKYSLIRPLTEKHIKALQEEYEVNFEAIPENYFTNYNDKEAFRIAHLFTVANFIKREQEVNKPLMTEQKHFVKLHNDLPQIRCTFDRINGDKDDVANWELEDYKTGKIYSSDKLQNNMQLPIYAMAIKELYGEYPKTLRLLFPQYLDSKGIMQIREFIYQGDNIYVCKVKRGGTYTIDLNQRLKQMIDIYSKIKRGEFDLNTSNQHFCDNFCYLNKQGMCESLTTKWQNINKRR